MRIKNRPFKFRAWDVIDKEFINFDNVPLKELQNCFRTVIMQFTGLKDKNGVEIYDGDIIQTLTGIGKVYFNQEYLHYSVLYQFDGSEDLDIGFESNIQLIGNIFENPELINK